MNNETKNKLELKDSTRTTNHNQNIRNEYASLSLYIFKYEKKIILYDQQINQNF